MSNQSNEYWRESDNIKELERLFVHPGSNGEEVIQFYVERPSPLLIPPSTYVRWFDEDGTSSLGY